MIVRWRNRDLLTIKLQKVGFLGPHSQNCPKTFSKDLPISDYLGIQKKFSFPNSRWFSLRFLRSFSFPISENRFNQSDALIQTTCCMHPSLKTSLEKVFGKLLGMLTEDITYTLLRCSSWPNANLVYLLIADLAAVSCKQYMTLHMTSELSVNNEYFCKNFIIITQLSFVRQGQCFPTYFPEFF